MGGQGCLVDGPGGVRWGVRSAGCCNEEGGGGAWLVSLVGVVGWASRSLSREVHKRGARLGGEVVWRVQQCMRCARACGTVSAMPLNPQPPRSRPLPASMLRDKSRALTSASVAERRLMYIRSSQPFPSSNSQTNRPCLDLLHQGVGGVDLQCAGTRPLKITPPSKHFPSSVAVYSPATSAPSPGGVWG